MYGYTKLFFVFFFFSPKETLVAYFDFLANKALQKLATHKAKNLLPTEQIL